MINITTSSNDTEDSVLSSAQLRYLVRQETASTGPGPEATRPLNLRFAVRVPTPTRLPSWYCHRSQVAVDESGRALLDAKGKEWETKSSTEGDEGPEENWGWEEK